MNTLTVLETSLETEQLLTKHEKIKNFIFEKSIDYNEFGFIVSSPEDQILLKDLLTYYDVFEDAFVLYKLKEPEMKNIFIDFGFTSQKGDFYLYKDLVIPFTISGNNEKALQHALEQMDEHLIASENEQIRTIYFVERYHQELIEGIAEAYKINVIFYL
ncbi:hypothetical protein BKP45_09385 [Anaerobacillus alkalidiazotrophicus]|uniref:Uncharacterized protein n=1 Tax=Anaerobacillus alkalidiazotrophicus TaxID=472963 RepID=A0A1S2M6Z9_9BACI|nr:hypothetical protein [Anaerobacillus alkalidiazotrophicus]OIJ20270.1 hypothetical protein BKP45_09385 [Anaerobacillus alkalidiazotrophicus]